MSISGLVLPISGIMNHLLQFELLTQKRHLWMSIHNMSGLLFTFFAIYHIILNWKTLENYLNKAKNFFNNQRSHNSHIICNHISRFSSFTYFA